MVADTSTGSVGATEAKFLTLPFPWHSGEHMAIVGNTGSGKTRLASEIVARREYLISLKSKADDTKIPGHRVRDDKAISNPRYTQFILEPSYFKQRIEFARAFERVWKENAWTVYIDELFALDQMKLRPFIDRMLTQGRSKHISVVTGMQRPVQVTRFALSQSTHIIIFYQEGRDLKTVTEITSPSLAPIISQLKRHEFVWYHVPTRQHWVGRLQELKKLSRETSSDASFEGSQKTTSS